ncbi:Aerobic respiration control sensor protein ArcB [Luteitalea pratensis]|uniref:Sensory/regulatory protein RpfC n=2 Tax=Luteitalea pratensis TaxID=1855912 RepID=A0A143PX29_LUTPR|nr:Aerobic respiration control sensor protein ArcB [Luteitalea pratensis]
MPTPGHGIAAPEGLDRLAMHRAAAWVVLSVSLLTCLLGWYHGDRTMRRRAEERFVHQAEDATAQLQEQLARYEDVLRGAAAFARSTPELDRPLWHTYASGLALRETAPGMVGLGFTPRVPQEDLAAHVARLRAQGSPAYDVWPTGQRADRYPVAYFEPESEDLRQALGFDLGSETARLNGIERARDSGRVVLVGGVRLRRDPRAPHALAFALLMPVYGASLPLGGPERQRSALLGFVYAPFRLPDVVAEIAQRQPAPRFSLREGGEDGPVLHLDEGTDRIDGAPLFTVVREVITGGQRWSLVFEAGPSSLVSTERVMSGVAALTALALNGVLAMLLFAQRRVRNRAEALAAERAVALQRSEGAFMAVAESARVAIVTTDAQGRLTYANATAEQILGASREQLRGVNSIQYIAEVDRERFEDGLRKFLSGKGRVAAGAAIRIMGRRHSGEVFPCEISLSWYDAPEGRYITGVLVDLTERLRTEAAARDAEERWKVALESTDDGVWDWDVAIGTLYGSRRLFELVGLDAPTGAINIDRWHALVHQDDLPAVLRNLDAHLAGGRDRYASEYRIQARDGDWRWLLARGRIITRDAHGRPARLVGTCTDVTERRHAEETLRFAREQAEQAARSKSDFLAIMSHELRTPMNGVLGMTNLLSSTRLTDEQREYLEIIGRSGNALLRLIDDILDFSKIEAGRVVLEQMTCDVGVIAREVVTLLSVQAQMKRLRLDAHVVPGTPAVITDPGRIRQVLFNLVGNAIKFTQAGAVHVTVAADAVEGGQVTLRVTVTDTGIGIAEDKQRLLFEKFTQADASTTRRFGGTGLGLAISKGLVESLGGTIGVTSTLGVGSQFWFTFVAPADTAIEPHRSPFTADVPDSPPKDASRSPGRRILVAEDNPVNQRVAVRMLEKLGYVADVAVDGREAVRMAQDTRYAVILMDCHMPDVDGYEATRRIREALSVERCPPILAMTAAGADGDRERCLYAGMSDYLSKPVQMPVLREMLERWTRTPGSTEQTHTAAEP